MERVHDGVKEFEQSAHFLDRIRRNNAIQNRTPKVLEKGYECARSQPDCAAFTKCIVPQKHVLSEIDSSLARKCKSEGIKIIRSRQIHRTASLVVPRGSRRYSRMCAPVDQYLRESNDRESASRGLTVLTHPLACSAVCGAS